jgi:hypothetical protein
LSGASGLRRSSSVKGPEEKAKLSKEVAVSLTF